MADMLMLAKAFAAANAEAAADELDGLPADGVAAFIADLPAEAAGQVLVHLRSQQTANCLQHLPLTQTVACLRSLAAPAAAEVLRRLSPDKRHEVLTAMPRARRVQIDLILRQPRQTVGAWMDTRIATARTGSTVGEAVRRLALNNDSTNGWLFIIGARRELAGAIRLGALMNAPAATRLDALIGRGPPPVSANIAVGAAVQHPGWKDHDMLPVIDGKQQLIGVLPHASLRRALTEIARAPVKDDTKGTIMDVANIWYLGMTEIMNAAIARKPVSTTPDRPRDTP